MQKKKYQLYEEITSELIGECNPIDYGSKSFIELFYRTAFGNDFLFQLTWDTNKLYYYRNTWQKESDKAFIANWWNDSNSNIQSFSITILKETGLSKPDIIHDVVNKIKSLQIIPLLSNELQGQGRDGAEIELKIGSYKVSSRYQWLDCETPKEWVALDDLVNSILQINDNLLFTESQLYKVNYELEELENSTDKFINIIRI